MNKPVQSIIAAAFFIRLALLISNTLFFTLPESGKDDRRFETTAWNWVTSIPVEAKAFSETGAGLFVKGGTALYSVFGRVPFLWAFILVIMGTVVVYNVYKATLLLWGDVQQAVRVAWFAALFPELGMLSAVLLREVVIHFFLSFAVVALIKYWKFKKVFSIITFVLFIMLCTVFHSAMVIGLAGLGLAAVLVSQGSKQTSWLYKVAAIVLVAGGLFFINSTGIGLSKFGGSLDNAYDKFQSAENREATGNAAYPAWMQLSGGMSDSWKIPIRLIAFLFSPAVPFMVRSFSHLAGVADAILYIMIFYSYYKNRKIIKANKAASVVLIFGLTLALAFSLGVSNFGTAIRHRAKLLPVLLVLAIDFKALKRSHIKKKKRALLKNQKLHANTNTKNVVPSS